MARIEILNPLTRRGVTHMAKHHKHHYKRHHRNPLGIGKDELTLAGSGVVGGVASLAIPAAFLAGQNTGILGYALNVLAALALKYVGDMASPRVGTGMLTGGLVATGIRVVRDNMPSIPMGAYWPSYFAVPTISNPIGQTLQSPYPMPALPAPVPAGKTMSGASRLAARF
jgi:hypothetical protein